MSMLWLIACVGIPTCISVWRRFFFQAEDGIRDLIVTGVQTCALPIYDLLRFSDYMPVHDKEGKDTLWLNVYYPEFEHAEIEANLNKIYTLLDRKSVV